MRTSLRALLAATAILSAFLVACEPEEEAEVAPEGCTADAACAADAYCDLTDGTCQSGCRSNASCPAGEVCDGNRVCVDEDPDTGAFGDTCADDTGCDAPLVCASLTGTCAEACVTGDACDACAGVHGTCSCNAFGFCAP